MSSNPFGPLAELVFSDEAIAASLASLREQDEFIACATAMARARGVTFDAAARDVPGADPVGVSRWSAPWLSGRTMPPRHWLPIHVATDANGIAVDWAWFGPRPLAEPFFEDSIRRTLAPPFGRLFRYRTALADLIAQTEAERPRAPDGFIFHMSRCGSTLAAQMFAALPQSVVISEAAPIDAAVQLARSTDWTAMRALRAIVIALGRRRAGDERRYVIKLDSWHALALPLFRQAFPDVPWVFLYRDPVEVLVSQMRQRGTQMLPEFFPPRFWGIDAGAAVPNEDYCARMLAAICGAAADGAALGGGLMIDYRDLPRAVSSVIAPHFGLELTAGERAAMQAASKRDAKAPSQDFAADSAGKRGEASEAVRRAAERHVASCYRRLGQLAAA